MPRTCPRPSPHPPWLDGRSGVLLVVTHLYAAVGLSSGALPVAVTDHGGDATAVGTAMGAYAFTTVAARLVVGARMSRWGYRRCLVMAAVLLATGQAVSTAALPEVLITGRLVMGLGVGALLAAATGWLVDLPAAQGRLANTLGSIGTVNYTVLALGAPAGAWIAHAVGPTSALWIAAAPPLLAIPLLSRLRAPHATEAFISSRPHSAARTASGGLTHVLGVGLALAAVGNPAIVAFGVRHGVDQHIPTAGAVVLVYGLSLVLARVVLAPLTPRLTAPSPTLAVFALEAAGIGLIATTRDPVLYLVAAAMNGVAMALTYPLVGAQLAQHLGPPGPARGRAMSVLGAYVNLGLGIGSALLGMVATRTTLTTALRGAVAAVLLAGLISYLPLRRRTADREHS